jgi:hypothetical protein
MFLPRNIAPALRRCLYLKCLERDRIEELLGDQDADLIDFRRIPDISELVGGEIEPSIFVAELYDFLVPVRDVSCDEKSRYFFTGAVSYT